MSTISTYSSYVSVNRDMKASLSRVANESSVARDTAYYEENIEKVTTVDEFLDDYKLYSYAMKAYGLEDMTYGKAFMRKVLESDLSDESSFVNTLTDKRYLTFAKAFNFSGDDKAAQNSVQSSDLTTAYKDSFEEEETALKDEAAYFDKQVDKITNVDTLVNNDRLRNYILDAVGIDSEYVSKSYLKQVLTSDLDDTESVANKAKDPAWKKLAEAFNFKADGTVDGTAQTDDQTEDLKLDYIYNNSTYNSDLLAEANQRYFEKNSAKASTATELVSDSRMLDYVKTAFGLSSSIMSSSVASLMSSETFASTYGNTELLDYFNFEKDGTLADGNTVQTSTQASATGKKYETAFLKDQSKAIDEAISNYETRITQYTSVEDFFVSNKKDEDKENDNVTEVWDVALRAYGIDPDEISDSELKQVLTSDPNDKNSYVNKLKDDRFVELNKAFNFTEEGDVDAPLIAQSESVSEQYASEYENKKVKGLSGSELEKATEDADKETEYFKTQMKTIKTVKELLADERLTNYVLEAKGIDPETVPKEELTQMFESDLSDPKSYVNSLQDNDYAEIVASFNFDVEGNLTSDAVQGGQQRGAILETTNAYIRQTLEEEQGESSEGVRLALYFERTASSISSAYGILSDDAVYEFIKTAFSLPDELGNMDVEKQADVISKYVDVTQLQDSEYVDKLIKRFTALYDTENATEDASVTILKGESTSISADTLLAVSQQKTS